jgi:hypothetical protein
LGGWDTKGVAAALRFKPADAADFTLRLSYSDDKAEPRPSFYYGQAVAGRNTTLNLPANAVGLRLGVNQSGAPLPASIRYPQLGEAQNGGKVYLTSIHSPAKITKAASSRRRSRAWSVTSISASPKFLRGRATRTRPL